MKTDVLLRQTRRRVPAFSAGEIEIEPIEKGGSGRRFYRIRCSPEQSLILVKYTAEREENRHYVSVARFLSAQEVQVPKVFFHDPEEGLIWLEDLGESDLFSSRHEPWARRRFLYEETLAQAAKLHSVPETAWRSLQGVMPPEFNRALYQWEQKYFFENCLGRFFKLDASQLGELERLPALGAISKFISSQPRVLIHRDLQSQNVIVRDERAFLIDFQGMRPGASEYDLASLLYDPYVVLTTEERRELFAAYLQMRGLPPDSEEHSQLLQLCAMQRLMQALGAYGFLGLVKGNRHFLAHIPTALATLREILGGIRGVEPLGAALANLPGDVVVG